MKSIVTEQATPADLKKYGFDKPQATADACTLEARRRIARLRRQRQRHRRLRARRVEAARRHRRRLAAQGSAEGSRRISPEGNLRVPPILHRSARVHARRPDDRVREGQDAGSDARQVASRQSERRRAGCHERGRSAHETRGPPGHLVSSTRPPNTGLDKPSLTVYAKFEDGTKEERVSFGEDRRDVYAAVPGQPGAVPVAPG